MDIENISKELQYSEFDMFSFACYCQSARLEIPVALTKWQENSAARRAGGVAETPTNTSHVEIKPVCSTCKWDKSSLPPCGDCTNFDNWEPA
jgi:hypothetical protein